ncbi:MAG: putative entry exclusion protein TrbK-alt [Pseudorhodoplanes sp.]|uniref:putative entry exclusion protein TrbK-alt n=1 Tax=Pseudorhodoplanes sp. TaxID=1934341 RepID=UPI003D0A02BE
MMKAWHPFKREENGDGGSGVASFLHFAAIAAAVAIAIIAMGEASRSRDTSRAVGPATETRDPLAAELSRCRAVLSADDTCRHIWAENRRRFFTPRAPVARTTDTPTKAQDRIPTSVTPHSSDEPR